MRLIRSGTADGPVSVLSRILWLAVDRVSIVIEPLGGLGNQLFVYAVGLALARLRDTELHCDTWNFYGYDWHVYELDTFPNAIDETFSSRSREIFGHRARRLTRRLDSSRIPLGRIGRVYFEYDSTFDPRVLDLPDNTRLAGYFQSWKYFDSVREEVADQVLVGPAHSAWLKETKRQLDSKGPWIALHIRRGNYTFLPSMGLADWSYYERALKVLDRQVNDELPVAVFSDSPELIRPLLSLLGTRATLIESPPGVRAIEVLRLMSGASHFVIGNSTFSWWGAFLADTASRVVIAPRPWLNDGNFNERDLLPPHWLTVGRSDFT